MARNTKPKIVINPTINPTVEKKKSTAPILRPYYWPYFFGAVPVAILTIFFTVFFYPLLPPVVPLFGSLGSAEAILTDKIKIIVLPILAGVIDIVHAFVIYFGRKYDVLILTIFAFFTIFIQVLLLAVLLRTVLVVI